jgi:hypothetical protein
MSLDTQSGIYKIINGEIIPAGKNFRRMCREKNLPHINLIRIMSDVKKVSYGWRVL